MSSISILDCTLRDGGYCNDWSFGLSNAHKIVDDLLKANIDIIECGFLSNRVQYDPDKTKFRRLNEIKNVIGEKKTDRIMVLMVNYGEYDANEISYNDDQTIDGIRVAFHKKDSEKALGFSLDLINKGYKVFLQPMVSLSYSDEEFLQLIKNVNHIAPYAFYIVDSFGQMKSKELIRLYYLVEHNLDNGIKIGFHSHNNLQLSYSNAQYLIENHNDRDIIIDSTVYGMGRGAGNLNTELFIQYLNERFGERYALEPLLSCIDEVLEDFHKQNYWGYSLPNYISAINGAHPNYASFFSEKGSLTVESMNALFGMMDDNKKITYDRSYADQIYLSYMKISKKKDSLVDEFNLIFKGKEVLLVSPGRSLEHEKDKLDRLVNQRTVIVISINFNYDFLDTDFIFVSNVRRFKEIPKELHRKCVITSNIRCDDTRMVLDYEKLLNNDLYVQDKAGLMAIRWLIECGAKKLYLAGFDGYSHDYMDNYMDKELSIITNREYLDYLNMGMNDVIRHYADLISIEMVTTPRFISLSNRKGKK